jgi:hypothetical protein
MATAASYNSMHLPLLLFFFFLFPFSSGGGSPAAKTRRHF